MSLTRLHARACARTERVRIHTWMDGQTDGRTEGQTDRRNGHTCLNSIPRSKSHAMSEWSCAPETITENARPIASAEIGRACPISLQRRIAAQLLKRLHTLTHARERARTHARTHNTHARAHTHTPVPQPQLAEQCGLLRPREPDRAQHAVVAARHEPPPVVRDRAPAFAIRCAVLQRAVPRSNLLH